MCTTIQPLISLEPNIPNISMPLARVSPLAHLSTTSTHIHTSSACRKTERRLKLLPRKLQWTSFMVHVCVCVCVCVRERERVYLYVDLTKRCKNEMLAAMSLLPCCCIR